LMGRMDMGASSATGCSIGCSNDTLASVAVKP